VASYPSISVVDEPRRGLSEGAMTCLVKPVQKEALEAALAGIRMAAPMHDVGKTGIPDAILRKPGKLTPEEFEVMKRHTTIGANMLSGSKSPILQMAQEIALNHHEHWNGGG
jgi:response regulator RpfG family c-di-GMP phosphodiesterase